MNIKALWNSLPVDIRENVRVFFAPITGALNAIREEINRPDAQTVPVRHAMPKRHRHQ